MGKEHFFFIYKPLSLCYNIFNFGLIIYNAFYINKHCHRAAVSIIYSESYYFNELFYEDVIRLNNKNDSCKKCEFSKLIIIIASVFVLVLVILTYKITMKLMNCQAWTILVGGLCSALSITLAFYYNKSKYENMYKLRKAYQDEGLKEQIKMVDQKIHELEKQDISELIQNTAENLKK